MQDDTYKMHALLSKFTTVIIIIKFDRVTGFITKYKKNTTNLYNKTRFFFPFFPFKFNNKTNE